MTDSRYNGFSVRPGGRASSSDAARTGNLSAAREATHPGAYAPGARTARPVAAGARRRAGRSRESNFVKYANDNVVVRAVSGLVSGPLRFVFALAVAAAIAVGLYFPIRDLYVAKRSNDILSQQVAIRKRYNETLTAEVDFYLSKDGIEQAARTKLGMVMPGETAVKVTGDEGSSSSDSSASGDASEPSTSSEVAAAEQRVTGKISWYTKFLDTVFFFKGVEGQGSSSAGK